MHTKFVLTDFETLTPDLNSEILLEKITLAGAQRLTVALFSLVKTLKIYINSRFSHYILLFEFIKIC